MNQFTLVKNIILSESVGSNITRQYMLSAMRNYCSVNASWRTLDSIRNYFTQAGYLQKIRLGVYKIIKKPNENMTKSQLLEEAYGKKYKYEKRTLEDRRLSDMAECSQSI